jgi:hypothetical protein
MGVDSRSRPCEIISIPAPANSTISAFSQGPNQRPDHKRNRQDQLCNSSPRPTKYLRTKASPALLTAVDRLTREATKRTFVVSGCPCDMLAVETAWYAAQRPAAPNALALCLHGQLCGCDSSQCINQCHEVVTKAMKADRRAGPHLQGGGPFAFQWSHELACVFDKDVALIRKGSHHHLRSIFNNVGLPRVWARSTDGSSPLPAHTSTFAAHQYLHCPVLLNDKVTQAIMSYLHIASKRAWQRTNLQPPRHAYTGPDLNHIVCDAAFRTTLSEIFRYMQHHTHRPRPYTSTSAYLPILPTC